MASTDHIDFNLDTVERDKSFEPFVFTLTDPETQESRTISLSDPAELDYQQLLEVETPLHFLRFTASQEDRDFIAKCKIKSWKLGKLMEAYYAHFELNKERSKLGF